MSIHSASFEAVFLDKPPTIAASMKVTDFSDRIANRDPRLSRRQGTIIFDEAGALAGMITRGDVLRAIEQYNDPNLTVIQAGSRSLVVTYPDEILYEAIEKMLRHDIGRLPVVTRDNPRGGDDCAFASASGRARARAGCRD
jgi:chloride channel protein, CIC family